MSHKNLPNFLIVGAPKAGTSSIAKYLDAHPEVFIPEIKEPRYFLHDVFSEISTEDPLYDYLMESSVLEWNDYLELYQNVDAAVTKFGDASVQYLYHHNTVIPQVKDKLGDIPIIIVLRDPIKRAFSNYKYQSKIDLLTFAEALSQEEERKNKHFNSFWYYKEVGLYYNQVNAYKKAFSSVHICLYDDLMNDPKAFMTQIYMFLNVDPTHTNDYTKRHNETIVPKNKFFQYINYIRGQYGFKLSFLPETYKIAIKNFFFKKNIEKISYADQQALMPFFIEDIKKLEKLIDRDLSDWYKDIT